MTMLLVLCALLLLVALGSAWGVRRRYETLAWNRELHRTL
jgi:hypothetical protein